MNNKKKMVLGAAFIVAIMALAGIGYAVAGGQFTAETSSASKYVDVDYATVVLDGNSYTQTTAPAGVHILWNTSTASNGTVTYNYNTTHVDKIDYTVTINVDALEAKDKINLEVTGLSAITGAAIHWAWDSGDETWESGAIVIGGNDGTEVPATTVAGEHHLYIWIVPTSPVVGTPAPATSYTIPALTFTVNGWSIDPTS